MSLKIERKKVMSLKKLLHIKMIKAPDQLNQIDIKKFKKEKELIEVGLVLFIQSKR